MSSPASGGVAGYREVVARVRTGIPVADAVALMHVWSVPVARFAEVLGVSERKWSRVRVRTDATLSPVESDRLMRVSQVFEHAKTIFDSDRDAVAWFTISNPVLSGESPLALLDTDAGVRTVDEVLTRIEFGVYG